MLTVPLCHLTIPSPVGFSKDATGQTLASTLTVLSPTDDHNQHSMTVALTWQLSVLCKLLSRRLLEHWKVNSSPLEYFSLRIFLCVIWLQPNVSFYFPQQSLDSSYMFPQSAQVLLPFTSSAQLPKNTTHQCSLKSSFQIPIHNHTMSQ